MSSTKITDSDVEGMRSRTPSINPTPAPHARPLRTTQAHPQNSSGTATASPTPAHRAVGPVEEKAALGTSASTGDLGILSCDEAMCDYKVPTNDSNSFSGADSQSFVAGTAAPTRDAPGRVGAYSAPDRPLLSSDFHSAPVTPPPTPNFGTTSFAVARDESYFPQRSSSSGSESHLQVSSSTAIPSQTPEPKAASLVEGKVALPAPAPMGGVGSDTSSGGDSQTLASPAGIPAPTHDAQSRLGVFSVSDRPVQSADLRSAPVTPPLTPNFGKTFAVPGDAFYFPEVQSSRGAEGHLRNIGSATTPLPPPDSEAAAAVKSKTLLAAPASTGDFGILSCDEAMCDYKVPTNDSNSFTGADSQSHVAASAVAGQLSLTAQHVPINSQINADPTLDAHGGLGSLGPLDGQGRKEEQRQGNYTPNRPSMMKVGSADLGSTTEGRDTNVVGDKTS